MILFWLSVIFILAFVCIIFYQTLKRNNTQFDENADLNFYKSQLSEIEKDVAKGVINSEEGEQVRIEISRRILKNQKSLKFYSQTANSKIIFTLIFGVFVIFLSLGLYSVLGNLGYSDFSQKDRIAAANFLKETRPSQQDALDARASIKNINTPDGEMGELVEKLRSTVEQRPNDLEGLRLLANLEASLSNFEEAAVAQMALVKIKGDNVPTNDLFELAELMVLAVDGYISPEAETIFRQVLSRDSSNGGARYYLGLMFAQLDRPDRSFEIWRNLLEKGPHDAPWITPIREQIMEVAWLAGKNRYELPPKNNVSLVGPTQEDIEASSEMTSEARQDMIAGMVEGLANRLESEGGTSEEWARLIRALSVLGEIKRAQKVWLESQKIFSSSPNDLKIINNTATEVGISE